MLVSTPHIAPMRMTIVVDKSNLQLSGWLHVKELFLVIVIEVGPNHNPNILVNHIFPSYVVVFSTCPCFSTRLTKKGGGGNPKTFAHDLK